MLTMGYCSQEVVLGKSIIFMLGDRCVDGGAFYLVAKSMLMRSINEESLLMLDAFRIFSLRVGRLMKRDMELIRLIEISEHSSCQNARDKVYAMIGLASDCQHGELIPDYAKPIEGLYRDIMFRHSDSSDHDSWLVVHSSALIQRSFWPLSSSLQSVEVGDATTRYWPATFKLCGFYIGMVSSMADPNANDMMWWAHPGLVKPIVSEPYLSAPQEKPLALFSSFPFFADPFYFLSSLVPRIPSRSPEHRNPQIAISSSEFPYILPMKHHPPSMLQPRHKRGISWSGS
jgi:hypothetical protein